MTPVPSASPSSSSSSSPSSPSPASPSSATPGSGQLASRNPATGAPLGTLSLTTEAELPGMLRSARQAQAAWAALSLDERLAVLGRFGRLLSRDLAEWAALLSSENGKPETEALSCELVPVIDSLSFISREARRLSRPRHIFLGKWAFWRRTSYLLHQPLGTVLVISPWNYPLAIPLWQIAAALALGNAVVFKPARLTPLIAKKIETAFAEAGLPPCLLQTVIGPGALASRVLSLGVDKVLFTGSVEVGRQVMADAAKRLTPVVLELGGKDPMIVCHDADLEVASSGAVWGAFMNCGQTCASVERLYVDVRVAEPFLAKVVEKTKALRLGAGNGMVEVGPMTSREQLAVVARQVEEARSRGARLLAGGRPRPDLGPLFYEPTVLTGVDHTFSVMREETFGPVLPVATFRDEEEAVRLANDSPYALTASVWSSDLDRAWRLAGKLRAGTVTLNECVYTHALAQTPWGGPGESGMGYSHGRQGMQELVQLKHVHLNRGWRTASFWWFPYSQTLKQRMLWMGRMLAPGLHPRRLLSALRLTPWILGGGRHTS